MKRKTVNLVLFIIAVAAVMAFRLYVQTVLPILPLVHAVWDDVLMIRYAERLSVFHWLGPYSFSVMMKLPGYAVFLAIGKILHLPYMAWYGFAWCMACLAFLLAVRPLFWNKWILLVGVTLLLFYPTLLDSTAQRVYNSAMIPVVTVFTTAGCLGAFVRRDKGLGRQVSWLVMSAVAYAYFCVVRFDVYWLSALVAGAGLLIFFGSWKILTAKKRTVLLCLVILPFILSFVGKAALSFINGKAYLIHEVSDFNEGNFAKVCRDLMQIRNSNEDPEVYVSREAMEKAFRESETLATLEPLIEKAYTDRDYAMMTEDGEFSREYYAWYLRAVADGTGHYKDSMETEQFYGTIHSELTAAFSNGNLQKKDGLVVSPFSGVLTANKVTPILTHSLKEGLASLVTWRFTGAAYNAAPDGEVKDLYENILNQSVPGETSEEGETARYDQVIARVNIIHDIWHAMGIILAIAAAVFFLLQGILLFHRKTRELAGGGWLFFVETGMLLAMWANLFILSANYYMFDAGVFTEMRFYAGGATSLWVMFICLCVGTSVDRLLMFKDTYNVNKEV